jgi:hypothetical protein
MYPGCVDLAEACRHGGDAERMRRAVGQLMERGFVETRRTTRGGLSSPELHLTEAGMAVAFGLASVDEDACQAIAARERSLLRDLDRLRARRLDVLGARTVPPSAATESERDRDER